MSSTSERTRTATLTSAPRDKERQPREPSARPDLRPALPALAGQQLFGGVLEPLSILRATLLALGLGEPALGGHPRLSWRPGPPDAGHKPPTARRRRATIGGGPRGPGPLHHTGASATRRQPPNRARRPWPPTRQAPRRGPYRAAKLRHCWRPAAPTRDAHEPPIVGAGGSRNQAQAVAEPTPIARAKAAARLSATCRQRARLAPPRR
jgi:hypothetical protein